MNKQFQAIVQTPQWSAIIAKANELCATIKSEPTIHDTEWETLRDTLLAEGAVRGITRLLQTVEREAFQDNKPERDE